MTPIIRHGASIEVLFPSRAEPCLTITLLSVATCVRAMTPHNPRWPPAAAALCCWSFGGRREGRPPDHSTPPLCVVTAITTTLNTTSS